MVQRILRSPAVLATSGKCRASHYNDIRAGLFTKPISIGKRAVGWPEREVEALQAARIAGKSDDEIRGLVRQLEAARKGVEAALT